MKATEITYSKLINKGNFQNEKLSITIEIEEGEKASEVLEAARKFVNSNLPNSDNKQLEARYQAIVQSPHDYNYGEVEKARKYFEEKQNSEENDLPF